MFQHLVKGSLISLANTYTHSSPCTVPLRVNLRVPVVFSFFAVDPLSQYLCNIAQIKKVAQQWMHQCQQIFAFTGRRDCYVGHVNDSLRKTKCHFCWSGDEKYTFFVCMCSRNCIIIIIIIINIIVYIKVVVYQNHQVAIA